jgi:hypothetical protein
MSATSKKPGRKPMSEEQKRQRITISVLPSALEVAEKIRQKTGESISAQFEAAYIEAYYDCLTKDEA